MKLVGDRSTRAHDKAWLQKLEHSHNVGMSLILIGRLYYRYLIYTSYKDSIIRVNVFYKKIFLVFNVSCSRIIGAIFNQKALYI